MYRIFAAAIFPELVAEFLLEILSLNSAAAAKQNELKRDVADFVGDATEYAFRNKSDPYNRTNDLVTEFAVKWNIDRAVVAKHAEMVQIAVSLETPIRAEETANQKFLELAHAGDMKHQWLKHLSFIGGARSIVSTQRMLQCLSNVYDSKVRLQLKRGFFGRQ